MKVDLIFSEATHFSKIIWKLKFLNNSQVNHAYKEQGSEVT